MDVIMTNANLAEARARFATNGGVLTEVAAQAKGSLATTGGAPEKSDDLLSCVAKLVPGEVAAGYTALLAIVSAESGTATVEYAAPTAIVLCSILIVMLIRRAGLTHVPPCKPHVTQYIVSVAAFLAWAFSIQNPLEGFGREVPRWICGFAIVLIPIFGGLVLQDSPDAAKDK